MFVKCVVVLSVLVGCVVCDDAGYAAPSQGGYAAPSQGGYAAPAASYGAPTGGASYAAPATGYGEPVYQDSYSYGAVEEEGGFNFDKITELLPLFIAVLAAIIIAQLILPFLASLGVLAVGILPMALSIKAPIVNAILAPFNLGLCDITNGAANPTLFAGRSFSEEFGVSEETGRAIQDTLSTFVDAFMSKF